jgi:N-acetylmuramoyl-L-alanine amidase
MKIKSLIILLLLICSAVSFSQPGQLALVTPQGTKYIPVYERQGTVYFSVKHFAEALNVNFYYNPETAKIELKFQNYNLKVSAKNPYLILTSKINDESEVYQLPTSTYTVQTDIFIPLIFSREILSKAYGSELLIEASDKIVVKEMKQEKKEVTEKQETETTGTVKFGILDLTIEEKANGTLIRVRTSRRIPSYSSSFKDGVLKIVFRKINADVETINKILPSGLVKKIEVKNVGEDTEFRFTLTKDYTASDVLNAPQSNDILITLYNKIFNNRTDTEKNKQKWEFDVVVIDPGHGGKDPGTIGVSGIMEKDVNLSIALKLGELIEKNMPEVKVVFTRKTDTFIDLYKRGKIANEKNGKLFISIHCNSTEKKPSNTKGFEVYLLRPGRTQEAINIAERENSVIKYEDDPGRYQQLTDENFILVSMAHSSYMKYSEKFAEMLEKQFSLDIDIASKGVKQAGFYVLVGASMPSVLIETGFLSNPEDAQYLKSKKGQQKIAESIFKSIKNFKAHYEKEILADG